MLVAHYCRGQQIVSGRVTNRLNKEVENVNIILYDVKTEDILVYGSSDKNGRFSLNYTTKTDSLKIEFSSIGYNKKSLITDSKSKSLNVVLEDATTELKEVIVKQTVSPISVKKDTINYSVKAFADSSDRAVIDIIKKLPGITVTPTGQILFNNKAINRFYIEGSDLLEDRYSIASNNLPSKDVETIQVLPDHQPIKVLGDRTRSDRAAINIKLKSTSKSKLIFVGSLTGGIPLKSREVDLAFLKFNRSLQYINTVKSNNVGINIDDELTGHERSVEAYESGSLKQDLVNTVKPEYPPIDKYRYWFNNNNAVSSNELIKLSKTLDLRTNIGVETDILSENQKAYSEIYLPNDTIKIVENHAGEKRFTKLFGGVVLETNNDKVFFKNAVNFQQIYSKDIDQISPSNTYQNLNNPFLNLNNNLAGIIKLKSNTISVKSLIAFTNLPQNLFISPGQFLDTLNAGNPFDAVKQYIHQQTFYANNSAAYSKQFGPVSFSNIIGITDLKQTLSNDLVKIENGQENSIGGDFKNRTERTRNSLYYNPDITFIKNDFSASLSLKASANRYATKSKAYSQSIDKVFFNPELSFHFKINNYFDNTLTLSTANKLLNDGNYSYILLNYRSLFKNTIPINETRSKTLSYTLNYRNIVRGIFANFNVVYSATTSDVLAYNSYDSIFTVRKFVLRRNPYNNLDATFNVNKYYDPIKTSFSIGGSFNSYQFLEFFQDVLTTVRNRNIVLNSKIISNISNRFSISHFAEWSLNYTSTIAESEMNNLPSINSFKQNLQLKLFISNTVQSKIGFEQYYSKVKNLQGNNILFSDFTLMKTFKKPRADVSAAVSNIFNIKQYESFNYSNNVFSYSNYALRSRMLLLKISFQL